MAWQTPKTNWQATDFFNIEDWNRIVGNIEYVKSLCPELYPEFSIADMNTKTYSDYLYAREINTIESNIYKINSSTFPIGASEQKKWVSNAKAPSYEDFNRWESIILRIKESLEGQLECLPRLSFILGTGGDLQV